MGQHCTNAVSILLFLSNFSGTVQINKVKVPDGRNLGVSPNFRSQWHVANRAETGKLQFCL